MTTVRKLQRLGKSTLIKMVRDLETKLEVASNSYLSERKLNSNLREAIVAHQRKINELKWSQSRLTNMLDYERTLKSNLEIDLTGAELLIGKLSNQVFQNWQLKFPDGDNPFGPGPSPWGEGKKDAKLTDADEIKPDDPVIFSGFHLAKGNDHNRFDLYEFDKDTGTWVDVTEENTTYGTIDEAQE